MYYELLPNNHLINTCKYYSQLNELEATIQDKSPEFRKRKDVTFNQDNARPYATLIAQQKLLEFGKDMLSLSSFTPGIVLSKYHLFSFLPNSLKRKNLNSFNVFRRAIYQILGGWMFHNVRRLVTIVEQNKIILTYINRCSCI